MRKCSICECEFDDLMGVCHKLQLVAQKPVYLEEWNVIFKAFICPECSSHITKALNVIIGELSSANGERN